MLSKIKQIAVVVSDVAASKEFYGKLGLKLLFEAPPGLVFFDLDGIWLMLSAANEKEHAQPGSVLYFVVDDINAAYSELQGNGVEFIDQPHRIADMGSYELWMTFFRDPDGTTLALRSEVAK
ncbi:MAG TPA: VOC family protein [Longimicrobiales bacterium]|nr:VOC family protein [Longimicrobiales bacterium]